MPKSLIKLYRDRRAATIVITALMITPIVLAAGAAFDFARITAARAQLQAAVDGAAIAGVGAYANDVNATNGTSVALAAFNSSYAGVANAVTLDSSNAVAGCSATTAAVCGTGGYTGSCPSATYCVTVTATATQKNGLFYPLFGENISVSGTAQYSVNISTTSPGATIIYEDAGQGYVTAGGVNFAHFSGIGAVSPVTLGNPKGYDSAVFYLDGINSALPPASITYASEKPPTSVLCGGSSPSITGDGNQLYSVPGGTYCSALNLGNAPSEEWNNITGSIANPISVINNNLVVEPDTVICPEILTSGYTYTGANVNIQDPCESEGDNVSAGSYTPIYFGQTSNNGTGSLVLNNNINITPSTGNSGVITFVGSEAVILQSTIASFSLNLGAAVCPGGTTSCATAAATAATVSYAGIGTVSLESTYISTVTIQNGEQVAWTEQKVLASTFVSSSGTLKNTQIAQAGGSYIGTTATTLVSAASVSPAYTPSSYAGGTSVGDAYAQLDSACSSSDATGTLGGTGAIGNTVGTAPSTPAVSPINVANAADLFALATDTPPNTSPPPAYNFTNPNYGYSFLYPNAEGAVLLTETAYFCGNGSPLQVSNGSATGLTVTTTSSSGGATLTN